MWGCIVICCMPLGAGHGLRGVAGQGHNFPTVMAVHWPTGASCQVSRESGLPQLGTLGLKSAILGVLTHVG